MKTIRMGQLMAATCVLLCVTQANAKMVTPEQAENAVRNWVHRNRSPLGARFSQEGANIRHQQTYRDADGQILFPAVNLEGGDSVVTAGDTECSPILAFNAEDVSLAEDERNDPQNSNQPGPLNEIDDVRVPQLVHSQWGQKAWSGGLIGPKKQKIVFNKFTPNNWSCGCVATAFAQIMRKWEYPNFPLAVDTYTYMCQLNEWHEHETKWQQLDLPQTMKGGTYDWSNMPLSEAEVKELSDDQIEAIGKLSYDVSVALCTTYEQDNSMAYTTNAIIALTNRFGYASARYIKPDLKQGTTLNENEYARNAILASLDAEMPVVVGLWGSEDNTHEVVTHEVVIDGYGYNEGTLYVHMNCGRIDGKGNGWYNVLMENINGTEYSCMDEISYNIHPTKTGDVISGRVLLDGKAVPDAVVTLTGSSGTQNTTSNTNGIYSFRVTANGVYSIVATSGSLSGSCSVDNSTSSDSDHEAVGNRWGNDIDLKRVDPLAEAVDNAELCFTTGGDAEWYCQSDITFDDIDAACSGFLKAGQSSWMRTTVTGSGKLSFRWHVPSESAGCLVFKINGSEKAKIEGSSDSWMPCTCQLENGDNTLEWVFSTEGGNPNGNAAGYVDQVEWQEMIVVPGRQTMLPVSEVDAYMEKYPGLAQQSNGHREAFVMLQSATGKLDARGNQMHVWQDILAGTNPTDVNDKFKVTITFENGDLILSWSPNLPTRQYTLWGRKTLNATEKWTNWETVPDAQRKEYPFRKVTVDFP